MSVGKAKSELARVQRDIARLTEQLNQAQALEVKIAHYIEMAQRYDNDADDALSHRFHREVPSEKGRIAASGTSYDAVQAVVSILRDAGKPIRTRDLLPMLEARGINIGGENPVTNLSGFLSRSPELEANRALGWHLVDWGKASDVDARLDELIHGRET